MNVEIDQVVAWPIKKIKNEVGCWLPNWQKYRAAVSGSDAIKKLNTQVLPKLDKNQSSEDYKIYLAQAIWFGASGKTRDAYKGQIFRKSPVYTANGESVSDDVKKMLEDVSVYGKSSDDLLRKIIDEVLVVNRVGALVDFQNEKNSTEGKATIGVYEAESIINWSEDFINGKLQPSLIVLKEAQNQFDYDNFYEKQKYQYRVLTLSYGEEEDDVEEGRPFYTQTIFKEKKDGKFVVVDKIVPLLNGETIDFIPFYIFSSDEETSFSTITPPIISDLVEMNIGHFRNSADFEDEIHKISIKSIVVSGSTDNDEIRVGSLINFTTPDAKAYYLESSSQSPLKEAMSDKKEEMAVLGAQALVRQGRYQQTAESAKIQASGEESLLGGLVNSVSSTFSKMLNFKLKWDGATDSSVKVHLNTDFWHDAVISSELLTLWGLVQSGGMSFDTYFNILKEKDVYVDGRTQQEEMRAIEETQTNFDNSTVVEPI